MLDSAQHRKLYLHKLAWYIRARPIQKRPHFLLESLATMGLPRPDCLYYRNFSYLGHGTKLSMLSIGCQPSNVAWSLSSAGTIIATDQALSVNLLADLLGPTVGGEQAGAPQPWHLASCNLVLSCQRGGLAIMV